MPQTFDSVFEGVRIRRCSGCKHPLLQHDHVGDVTICRLCDCERARWKLTRPVKAWPPLFQLEAC